MFDMKTNADRFTVEIVKDSLVAIGEEMFHTLSRTSMSPIIYEVRDFACGLTDAKGQILTQGNGLTGFIGMLSYMVKGVLEKFGEEGLRPGDIIIVNDPYSGGGSHLSDVGLVMPIHYDGELIGFSCNKAHWTEVGGKDPGSWTTDSTEIFQEGLQFPCVKLFNEGRVNEALVDMIRFNVRFPDLSIGDMWSQVAALRTGEKRFCELCDKYGKQVVMGSVEHLLKHGEQLSRKAIEKLPKGIFEAHGFIDNDGMGTGPIHVQVKVTITDEEFICDFRGSHPQVKGPINCSYTSLVSAVRTVFLAVTNPSQDVNDGVFSPLKVITDNRSIFSAERPAAVSTYFETQMFGADLVWKALAPVVPHRLTAGNLVSACCVILSGTHHDTNEPFLIVEPSAGGWGAGEGLDGVPGQFCIGDGETYNVPVEIAETRYGVMVEEYSLRADGAGAGEFRGGSGVVRAYRAMSDGQMLTASFERHNFLPWGYSGGRDGSRNEFIIEKANGEVAGPFGKYARFPLNKGDVVRLITATGGGYGDPLDRPWDKVVQDVKNGYISLKQAAEIYGVILDPVTFDVKETVPQRQK
ncbi:hydantoinase B/oxoprolinase family protein [uncultured Brevibacillus sp.]|uniref:hydantoinase B/oxoprolinase family protein n=1 Tax=uncultured Brevibacillus sp. TaxID=169970 RepID=UPI0025958B28|nr:hydantoinase B/oxoprolinase family protein [uncultured Brevibacillus sp.]